MIENNEKYPVGGVDYPRTLQEFDERFASEAACAEYLRRVQWLEDFRPDHIPRVGGREERIGPQHIGVTRTKWIPPLPYSSRRS